MIRILKEHIHLTILLVLGFIVRFSISGIHSYSSDELSAINRLNYNSLGELLEFGVEKGDMHPAGIQLFEKFWSSLFGTSEIALRFPFVVMGVLSIWIIYLIGKDWMNKSAGLIAAVLLTSTYFPIIHSELARPYSPGLLFSLLSAYYWLKLLRPFKPSIEPKHSVWFYSILLGISLALAMYTHYFAFLFVAFVGLTGFIYVKKETLLPFIASGFIAVVLFLPHIGITLTQLGVEGGLQWLGKPSVYWILEFIFYAFNESWYLILILLVTVIAVRMNTSGVDVQYNRKIVVLFIAWFFGIYLIGYIFSLTSSPILKFPVMLFPLPFLFLSIGHLFRDLDKVTFNIVFITLLLAGTASTIVQKDLYGNKHFGVFKELAEPMVKWRKKLGKDNIRVYMNLSNPNYLNFYAKQLGDSIMFNMDVIDWGEDRKIREELINATEDYCIVGYSARFTPAQVLETCKESYPCIIDYIKLQNCAVVLLGKDRCDNTKQDQKLISSFHEKSESGWIYKKDHWINGCYVSDSSNNYGPRYMAELSKMHHFEEEYLLIKVEASSVVDEQLTVTFSANRDGSPVTTVIGENLWFGKDIEEMLNEPENNEKAYYALKIPEEIKNSDEVIIEIWNRNSIPVQIKDVSIYMMENIWN